MTLVYPFPGFPSTLSPSVEPQPVPIALLVWPLIGVCDRGVKHTIKSLWISKPATILLQGAHCLIIVVGEAGIPLPPSAGRAFVTYDLVTFS